MNPRDDAAASARLERSVRRWMNAYPRRWRVTFGDDLVGTALELAVPGQTRLTLRDGLAIVRAGWALRRREMPPLRVRVGWYWDGRGARTHPEHRPWMVDRIISPWTGVAAAMGRLLLGGWPSVWFGLRSMMRGDPAGAYGFFLVMGLLVVLLTGLAVLPGMRRYIARQRWTRSFPDEPVPDMIASRRKRTSA